ncbi:DUF4752 family protein [Escherichia coli]|uniref:DUF4752 family protein n=1 Tax=Escherichia coli TaxID=562 RepID=UPI00135E7BD6|nr:DUF4752 family protein [Escherichia coli]MXF06718.1 DUF4752 family protein [Escherichia coli]
MNTDTAAAIATALNIAFACVGWLYIAFNSGRWLTMIFLKQWVRRRKEERRQKALNEFCDVFGLDEMEPDDPARVISRGNMGIMVWRSKE